ncbi:MAG: hypothetical protein SPI77_04785 [Corynebacterium sp.]|nr:hypothetical protein [Corynebacterium sp.]
MIGRRLACMITTLAVVASGGTIPVAAASPVVKIGPDGEIHPQVRTAMAFTYSPTGWHTGSANEHDPMAAVSLVKLYIADYVLEKGTAKDKQMAVEMLQTSNDMYADYLHALYPEAIRTTLAKYHLEDSIDTGYWGTMMTSAYDIVSYLEQAKKKNSPVIAAMKGVKPVAADGYKQNYGTSRLPQVTGSKFGWANLRNFYNASASIGEDFSVVAFTIGSAADNTEDVLDAFVDGQTFSDSQSVASSTVVEKMESSVTVRRRSIIDRLRERLLPDMWRAGTADSSPVQRTPSVVVPVTVTPTQPTTSTRPTTGTTTPTTSSTPTTLRWPEPSGVFHR